MKRVQLHRVVSIGLFAATEPRAPTLLAVGPRTVYAARYGGKTAHYLLRWVSTTGEKGAWSETAGATIGA